MGLLVYIGLQLFFLILFSLPVLGLRDRVSQGTLARAFAYGFAGWLLAFLRIILIQIWQIFVLVRHGVNYLDSAEITHSPVIYSYEFNLLGPILSGLFEEPVRYLLLFAALKHPEDRNLRKYLPLVFGLGWAYSEILIVTLPFLNAPSVDAFSLSVSVYERAIATVLHVCLTYVVLYGKIDRKRSLWLAILVHDLINTVLVVMMLELRHLDPTLLVYLLEGVLTFLVGVFVLYARIHIRNRETFLKSVQT
ncbi:MAG: YhfC family intramembrane metalloprotease [Methanobacteriota archaeon]|nr:MAG: YhfC family intramembrane metalloprotease [Euryarchaeota archaeon]